MTESSGSVFPVPRYAAGGFHMIRSLEVENLRGFRQLELNDLGRINVIVGSNATGKTTLLEAIFIASGASPELAIRTRAFRGREGVIHGELKKSLDSLWSDLFFNFTDQPIRIAVRGDERGDREFIVTRGQGTKTVTASGETLESDAGTTISLQIGDDEPLIGTGRLVEGGVQFPAWVVGTLSPHFLAARMNLPEQETARTYSSLRVEDPRKAEAFEKALLSEFEFLSDLSPEAPDGSHAIYAKVQGVTKKLPLSLISGGINQVAGILVRVASAEKGIVCIDEIENGVFHERYEALWRALYTLTETNKTQLFVTTHSLECIKALASALSDQPEAVRFIKASRSETGLTAEAFSGKSLFKAARIGDVRTS